MSENGSRKTHRTFALIVLAWAATAGLYVSHPDWSPWPWVGVVLGGLSLWIGGKAVAVALVNRAPKA